MCGPSLAADLDGPGYRLRKGYVGSPAPVIVIERRIIVHHYHRYGPREGYALPVVYAPYRWSDTWYDGTYGAGRSRYYAGRPYRSHRHHRRR
jgi:hypothetical protein